MNDNFYRNGRGRLHLYQMWLSFLKGIKVQKVSECKNTCQDFDRMLVGITCDSHSNY